MAFDGRYIWMTNGDNNNVSKIDVTKNAIVDTVQVENTPANIAFDGRYIWVANWWSNSVRRPSIAANAVSGIESSGNGLLIGDFMECANTSSRRGLPLQAELRRLAALQSVPPA